MVSRLKKICPNCNEVWDETEIEYQVCAACGYPDHEPAIDEYDKYYPDEP